MQFDEQQINGQSSITQRKKLLSFLGIISLALVLLLSVLNDNIFLDRLLPAAGIVSLILLVRNLGERQ